MKFGIYLPTYGPELSWAFLKDAALAAEGAGLDGVFSCDHLLDGSLIESQRGCPPDIYESWTVLSALASVTQRISLGTSIASVPYRYPGVLAKAAVTLDHISDGRVILGLGAGWNEKEFEKHGVPWASAGTRLAMLEEAVDVIQGIWRIPGYSSGGRFWSVRDAECNPAPTQVGGPPIWVGGVGARARRLVAERCDGWLPVFVSAQEYSELGRKLDADIIMGGRKVSDVAHAYLCFASVRETDVEAGRVAAPFMRDLASHRVDGSRTLDVSGTCVVGSVDTAVRRCREYADAGVDYMVFGIMPMEREAYLENIELLGAGVLPLLRKGSDRKC